MVNTGVLFVKNQYSESWWSLNKTKLLSCIIMMKIIINKTYWQLIDRFFSGISKGQTAQIPYPEQHYQKWVCKSTFLNPHPQQASSALLKPKRFNIDLQDHRNLDSYICYIACLRKIFRISEPGEVGSPIGWIPNLRLNLYHPLLQLYSTDFIYPASCIFLKGEMGYIILIE